MSPSIRIFWFSGTGNTKLVAELFAASFTRRGAQVQLSAVEDALHADAAPVMEGADLVGLGYPVHAFNAPRLVFNLIDRLPKGTGKRAFTFKCPGDSLCQGGSTSMVRAALERRGYEVVHESLIVGPANVAIRFDDGLVRQLYVAAQRRVALRVDEILGGVKRLQRNGPFLRLATWLFSSGESRGARWFGRALRVAETCTRCGKCIRSCPARNISLDSGRVRFGSECTFCMRCNYTCPVDAISPGFIKFMKVKGFSEFGTTGANEALAADFVTPRTRGYFRHYWDYLQEP